MVRKRHSWLGLVCIVLCILIGLTSSSSASAKNEPNALQPRVFLPLLSQEWSSGPAAVSLFGVSDSSEFTLAASPQAQNLALAAAVSGNRTSVAWSAIEPVRTTPAQFNWSSSDAKLLPLLQQGFS